VPDHIAKHELWIFFLKQRDRILKDKWTIQKRRYDIGMERALRTWLQSTRTSGPPTSPPAAAPAQPSSALWPATFNTWFFPVAVSGERRTICFW